MYKVNEAYLQFKCAITSIPVFSYTLVIGTSSTLTFYQVQEQAVDTNRSEVYYKSLVCTTTLHKQNQVSTFHFLYLLPTLYHAIFCYIIWIEDPLSLHSPSYTMAFVPTVRYQYYYSSCRHYYIFPFSSFIWYISFLLFRRFLFLAVM